MQDDIFEQVIDVVTPMLGVRNDTHLNLHNRIDLKIHLANEAVKEAMKDKTFSSYINHKHNEYIHSGGWDNKKMFKDAMEIPYKAFFLLPEEIRDNDKELKKWVKQYHPYLLFTEYGIKKGSR